MAAPIMYACAVLGGALAHWLLPRNARDTRLPVTCAVFLPFLAPYVEGSRRPAGGKDQIRWQPADGGGEILARALAGGAGILGHEQIARANASGGVNVAIGFGGWVSMPGAPDQVLVMWARQVEAFHAGINGFRVNEILAQVHSPEMLRWALAAGLRTRPLARGSAARLRAAAQPRSRLVGLTRREAAASHGSQLFGTFIYTPPRFHFAPGEQALLQHALLGETDDDLASSLFISRWTVKKRWQAIYQRVEDVDAIFFPSACAEEKSSRGCERRRHLMNYLRQHREELRPYRG